MYGHVYRISEAVADGARTVASAEVAMDHWNGAGLARVILDRKSGDA
jgi:hypothetical protein